MGKEVIQTRLEVKGELGMAQLDVLIDTGASASFAKRSAIERLCRITKGLPQRFLLGDNKTRLMTRERTTLDFELEGYWLCDMFLIVDRLPCDLLLGVPTLQRWEIDINFRTKKITIGLTPDKLRLV